MPQNSLVTGGAGFIAATLIERLLQRGDHVTAIDNLCRGTLDNVRHLLNNPRFSFVQLDLLDTAALATTLNHHPITEVWHLAANSDIPAGVADPAIDLRHTFMTTFNLLLAMRARGIRSIMFASSSAIYGDLGERALTEDAGPLFPISNYGAMKLASEAQITAAAESFLDRAVIFRFPNVVGVPATHGVILDFTRKLKQTPTTLPVLGDGTQQKSYLHVSDLVDAMFWISSHDTHRVAAYNVGPVDHGVTVRQIAEEVVAAVSPSAHIAFGTGNKGWVGDVPRFHYSVDKLRALGWSPHLSSLQAIQRAVREIATQEGALCRP